jgi:trehalose 6-phosphate synthase/phosphatase
MEKDMFRALENMDLPKDHVFTVTVGPSSKATDASYHLLEPADVIENMGVLVGTISPQEADSGTGVKTEEGDVATGGAL